MHAARPNAGRNALAAATSAILALAATPSHAQQAPEGERRTTLEEIVVTAQKREESLLEVPMSITAVTGDALANQGVATLQDIASTIPGLSMLEYAPGQQRIQLRGISASTNSPVIGLYLDELPINIDSVQQGADVRFLDLERIEVLRGPQGTLYGEGSMGGTIKYVTRDPQLDSASFGFDGAWGSVADGSEMYRVNAVANLPVSETFGLRLVGGYDRGAGWADYPLIGEEDVNEGSTTSLRAKALWKVSDTFTASLMLMRVDSDYDSQNFADSDREAPYLALQPYQDENTMANLVLTWDAGSFTLLSSTGYIDRTSEATYDVSGFFVPIYTLPPPFGFGFPPGSVETVMLFGDSEYEVLSQELRMSSSGEGPLQWTVGLYYRDYEETFLSSSATIPNPLPFEVLESELDRTSEQFAAFGEVTYGWTERFDTTLGLRYFEDKRTKSGVSANFGFPTPEPDAEETFDTVNPRIVASYKPVDGQLYYASAAKGFRSGGFNLIGTRPPGCELPASYEPEDLWTYEIGTNLALADGRVVVQGAVYRNEWKDIQVSEFCPGTQATQTTNVGSASGTGVDLTVTLSPVDSLTLTLSGGYNDSQYDETSASHQDGDAIDFVPELTYGLAADWSFRLAENLPGSFHVDYQYTDEFTIALRNFPGPGIATSDSLGRLNARVAVSVGDWEFSVFGQNLTDEDGAVMPPIGVLLVPVSLQPRTIGLGLRYNW